MRWFSPLAHGWRLLALSLLMALDARAEAGAPATIDFNRDVRPILSENCSACHGPDANARKGGLRLDMKEGALRADEPVIVPGHAEESELILRVVSTEADEVMPPRKTGKTLTPRQVETLKRWIDEGAPWGTHWAFDPPRRPALPPVNDPGWANNPIDRFLLAALEAGGIAPAPEAEKATLLRRVALDLTGLPPTPEELDSFLTDTASDAYERAVDRLLASPHHGERWARGWLDLARYADSNGYSIDAPRSIWTYRNWVIDALNRDVPFDEFATDQLAGDLKPGATMAQLVATGFHRNTPINQEGGIDREQFRIESVIDRANTTATAFLGLTMGCCQCHDHKYDPIRQEEYYRLFAFFNNCDEPEIPVASPERVTRRKEVDARVSAYLETLWDEQPALRERQDDWEQGLDMVARQKQSQEVREAFDTPFAQRDPAKNRVAFAAFLDQSKDPAVAPSKKALAALRAEAPSLVTTMIVRERTRNPRATHLLIQGDFTRPGPPVTPGVPAVLPPLHIRSERADRLDLARWLFDPSNPLTARVTVNRLWQVYFGRGLVETENDFGTQGAPPTHPALLDWLADEFRASGWSLKAMHRLIVTSAAYRQSSHARPELDAVDPTNKLLARQSRLRLDAELIRDAALAASGLLTRTVGGPSVFPPQPDGVMNFGQMRREWKAESGPDRYRRGLYTFLWRATPHPMLTVFDAPDSVRACTRRERSNTPLQALTLLNDEAFYECARALADRILRDGPADDPGRIAFAFRLVLARRPSTLETTRLTALLSQVRDDPERDAWTTLARVLLNLDEFVTRE